MKKNRTMRAAVLMLALTLITSCFVGSTFAKYTTGVSGNDTARVAKFGVQLTADANLFGAQYNGVNGVSVKSDVDVIAPGTTGTATFFTISGAPEVDVAVAISLGTISMATLPVGTYSDWTTVDGSGNPVGTFEIVTNDYSPVKWTLTKNGAAVTAQRGTGTEDDIELTNVNLDVINDYLEDELSGQYDVNTNEFANIVGSYELTWTWAYDGVNDIADTFMGQIAAGVEAAPTGYEANESFALTIRVEQVD